MTEDNPHRRLSPDQERTWFLDQFVHRPALHLALAVRLSGPLDVNVLEASFADALADFPTLTTPIHGADGRPTVGDPRRPGGEQDSGSLVVRADGPVGADALDLDAAARDALAEPFDLAGGRLVRACVVSAGPREHAVVFVAHRVGCDRYTLACLADRTAQIHTARLAGAAPGEIREAGDYGAFADAQRQAAHAPEAEELAAAWRAHLADLAPIELPTDRNRPVQPRYAARAVVRELPAGLIEAAAARGSACGVAAADVLRAAFISLLHRYTGHEALAVGTIPPRPAGQRSLFGPVDTLGVVRSEAGPQQVFSALLAPDPGPGPIPFERLVEAVDPSRDPTRAPIVQVVVSCPEPVRGRAFGAATVVGAHAQATGASLYDLEVWIDAGAPARITAVYRTDLFDHATIERLTGHYAVLLAAAAADPGTAVFRLPMLDDAERAVLESFNDTDVPFPDDATVQELFEAQALRSPEARAVTFEGRHLSYRELNERANRLAHLLRRNSVGRGSLVGVCLERSFDLIVTAMAILKAGAAYVPLDPAYPADRLSFMLEDTGAPLVLTQRKFQDVAPTAADTTLWIIDDDAFRAEAAGQPAENPENPNTADDLTYIVYTSGSTGRPKGVRTIHRGVVRLVIDTDILELDERTSYLQISPLSFDANTLEIYGPLLNGGRVVLLPPQLPTPALIARTVLDEGVDTIWLVSPLANLTIDTHLDALAGLRQFMAGGDVLSIPHMRAVRERLPKVKLVNGYGPTEVTAFSVSHKIDRVDPDWPSVPIGRPMHNTTAYILDDAGEVLPIGVWGELYLGGPGVALGYHNRPELNATRFLPDRFRPGPGARLYRTGDRCRWLPDGTIQFQGRLDTQVKVDGLRIELGEIQSVVAAHESVGAAVVVAPYVGGRRVLVAYVVPADAAAFDVEALRNSVSAVLPSVMVPAHYVVLDTIPLMPNNKVDFRALPEPDLGQGAGLRPPETPTQQSLARIWQEILGVPQVGIDDNFFQLGGQSLRAVPMIVAVSMAFGVDLAVQDVFETPVLGRLAERIEQLMLAAVPPEELERLMAEVTGG